MSSPGPLNRRHVLRAAALAVLASPVAAACSGGYDDGPDPLRPLLRRATADAEAARALAASAPEHADLAEQVAAARSVQERALRAEVERLNRPVPESAPAAPPSTVEGIEALGSRLADARRQAAELVPKLPRHRAGLVGSVAAGCAALQQLAPALGAEQPGEVSAVATGALPEESVSALQEALAAEHAAVWVYGLVSAFLPADFGKGIDAGAEAHRDRRDACERVLAATGATPRPPEPAYLPPEPVTGTESAQALVITAETDAATAWHGVLERTDNARLRILATESLVGSATRCTSWRMEAGAQPAALALPGRNERRQ